MSGYTPGFSVTTEGIYEAIGQNYASSRCATSSLGSWSEAFSSSQWLAPRKLRASFESTEEIGIIEVHRYGKIIRKWQVFLCRNYRTLPL